MKQDATFFDLSSPSRRSRGAQESDFSRQSYITLEAANIPFVRHSEAMMVLTPTQNTKTETGEMDIFETMAI